MYTTIYILYLFSFKDMHLYLYDMHLYVYDMQLYDMHLYFHFSCLFSVTPSLFYEDSFESVPEEFAGSAIYCQIYRA